MIEAVIALSVGDRITVDAIERALNGGACDYPVFYMKDNHDVSTTLAGYALCSAVILANPIERISGYPVIAVTTMWPREWTPHTQLFYHDGSDFYSVAFSVPMPGYIELEFVEADAVLGHSTARFTNVLPDDKVLLKMSAC